MVCCDSQAMVVNGDYGQCDENNTDENDHAPFSMFHGHW